MGYQDELSNLFHDQLIAVHCAALTSMCEGVNQAIAEIAQANQAKADLKNQQYAVIGIAGSIVAIVASVAAAPAIATVVGVEAAGMANAAAAGGAGGNIIAAISTYGTNFVNVPNLADGVLKALKERLKSWTTTLQHGRQRTLGEKNKLIAKLRAQKKISYPNDKEPVVFSVLFEDSNYQLDLANIKDQMDRFILRELYSWISSWETWDSCIENRTKEAALALGKVAAEAGLEWDKRMRERPKYQPAQVIPGEIIDSEIPERFPDIEEVRRFKRFISNYPNFAAYLVGTGEYRKWKAKFCSWSQATQFNYQP